VSNNLCLCIITNYSSEEWNTEGTTLLWRRSMPLVVPMMTWETRQHHGGWERTSHAWLTVPWRRHFRTFQVDLGVSQDSRCSFAGFEMQGSIAASYKKSAILCLFLGCCCNYYCSLNCVMQI